MSTITAILTPSSDGTLHLPLPSGWPEGAVRVKAELMPVMEGQHNLADVAGLKGFGCLHGKVWMAPDFEEPLEDFRDYSA